MCCSFSCISVAWKFPLRCENSILHRKLNFLFDTEDFFSFFEILLLYFSFTFHKCSIKFKTTTYRIFISCSKSNNHINFPILFNSIVKWKKLKILHEMLFFIEIVLFVKKFMDFDTVVWIWPGKNYYGINQKRRLQNGGFWLSSELQHQKGKWISYP